MCCVTTGDRNAFVEPRNLDIEKDRKRFLGLFNVENWKVVLV